MLIPVPKQKRKIRACLLVWMSFIPLCIQAAQNDIPERHLIKGVPFISWNQMVKMDYPGKDNYMNPSSLASNGMVWTYWGIDLKSVFKNDDQANKDLFSTWNTIARNGETLEELKEYIAKDMPVKLEPTPQTTLAHPLYGTFRGIAAGSSLKLEQKSHCSWLSGDLLGSYDWITEYWETLGGKEFGPLQESVYYSGRVLVGYDDSKRVVYIHDPTFGPAWEVDYETFENMWKVANNRYVVMLPENHSEILSKVHIDREYRRRYPDEHGVYQLLHGCGLSALGRYQEAEEELAKGVKIEGLSKGYQHLLLFELARHQAERGAIEDAIESTKLAIKKFSKNYYSWEYLVVLYKTGGYDDGEQKAAEKAEKKAHKLREKTSAARAVARTIPSDYYIPGLAGLRGWGL